MYRRERPQVLFDATLHTSHMRNRSPRYNPVWKLHIMQRATPGKGQGSHMGPNSKDELQWTEHTMRERISEETKNPPLETPAGLQTGSPDRTPTSPREADGEFFLLRFSSVKKSWRARRPIFSTCSAGGNAKEQRARGY